MALFLIVKDYGNKKKHKYDHEHFESSELLSENAYKSWEYLDFVVLVKFTQTAWLINKFIVIINARTTPDRS